MHEIIKHSDGSVTFSPKAVQVLFSEPQAVATALMSLGIKPEIMLGNPNEADVQAQVRAQVGDDKEIIGGGADTGYLTGVR
jgi:hypothetical protein